MFKESAVLFLLTETPLHAGSGASVVGADLPIQRERHTNFPMIQASGVKGVFRDLATTMYGKKYDKKKELEVVFGPETNDADKHGGALAFTDARILLFPVRSLAGVFAWVTCPTVIERLKRDLEEVRSDGELQGIPVESPSLSQAFVTSDCEVNDGERVILEDFVFDKKPNHGVERLAKWLSKRILPTPSGGNDSYAFWRKKIETSLVLVHDDVFRDFAEFSTEVINRIRIGENGVVETGALWSEEHLPSETFLYSLLLSTDPRGPKNTNGQTVKSAGDVLHYLEQEII
ncbi:MAG: type III-B CRISPR module RAMP protein Cmr4, partial [Deltaproteobacteria bacterium]